MIELIWNHPANQGRRVRTLVKSVAWQLYKRLVRRPLDIRRYGFKFRCYPDSGDASRMIYFNGFPDPQEMTFIERYLRPGDNVIDAGANVGLYTLFLASLTMGKILAFEPDPSAASRLRENVSLNGLTNVSVRQAAISDTIGSAAFTRGADEGNALYSIRTYGRPPQMVEVTTLDTEIGADTYALCKMDVEGAEWAALKGAAESLARSNPPVWLVELSDKLQARAGTSVAEIEAWLKSRGYDLWRYDPETNSLNPFANLARKPGLVGDAIAIASDSFDMVKERLDGHVPMTPCVRRSAS